MADIDELTQLLHEKENELVAANREINRLQTQLDESRERESHLATESQSDSIRNNDRIRFLTQHQEEIEAELREATTKLRQAEEGRRAEEASTQRIERELRMTMLDVHNKEADLADAKARLQVLTETQEQCEALKKRVAELEDMQRGAKEDFRLKVVQVGQLEDTLAKRLVELEETRGEVRLLKVDNEKLGEEVTRLLSTPAPLEPQMSAKALVLCDSGRVTPETRPLREADPSHSKHMNTGVDIGGSYNMGGYGYTQHYDDEYLETPRRGSMGDGYSEPLLKDATVTGASLLHLAKTVDSGTQTITQMGFEDDESKPVGCPNPKECVIC